MAIRIRGIEAKMMVGQNSSGTVGVGVGFVVGFWVGEFVVG